MGIENLPPTISVEEAARLLGPGRSTANKAASTGELSVLRFGKHIVVPTRKLRAMLGYEGNGHRSESEQATASTGSGT